jgi:aspartate racemase
MATVNAVAGNGVKRVGVLGTPTTVRVGLYRQPLAERGIALLEPAQQQIAGVEAVIRAAIAGEQPRTGLIDEVVGQFLRQGAEAVILGCTELSLAMSGSLCAQLIDPMDCVLGEIFGHGK